MDLRSKTRNCRYRGQHGVGIEGLGCCQDRRGCNSTNSQTSVTPIGAVNSVVQSKKALLMKCLNYDLTLVYLSAALAGLSHGNQLVKTKPT